MTREENAKNKKYKVRKTLKEKIDELYRNEEFLSVEDFYKKIMKL
jgi:hypothetical protein